MSTKKIRSKKLHHKIHKRRKKKSFPLRVFLLIILCIVLLFTGNYLKNKIEFYYAMYFKKYEHKILNNSISETKRINRIIEIHNDKIFGMDISHYQRKEDIRWDSLTIANGAIPIDFVILRATMGNKSADKHFNEFWKDAKLNGKIRGAYHFYRADEDPIQQANNFLNNVKLESGDLPPVLDIEKIPRRKTTDRLLSDLKIWCNIIEQAVGKKPIIYTYYYYYKDYLKDDFKEYKIWLANYNDVSEPSPDDNWDFWQFTENGIIQGIDTKVDLDIYNGGKWSLKRLTLD